jgi:hypothetical protein
VKFHRIGYATKVVQGVVVTSDQTTTLDLELKEAALPTEAVVVTAERLPVDLNVTSTQDTLTEEEIADLPVQDLTDVVNIQAGVVDGHFRGGRKDEVQYQVDGVPINNAYDNSSTLILDRSLLQEVQVISGTFDAEYGQAMSGVVNAVLKEGSEKVEWSGEAYMGGYYLSDPGTRLIEDSFQPGTLGSLQGTLSGPLFENTVGFVSGRLQAWSDYVQGILASVPTDSLDFEHKHFDGSGDSSAVDLGWSREWSGAAKLTNSSILNAKLNYQAIVNYSEGRRTNYAYRLNPMGASTQKTFSISHGLDWSHALSKSTYLDLSLTELLPLPGHDLPRRATEVRRRAGDRRSELRERGHVQGGSHRFIQETNASMKGSVVPVRPERQMKAGSSSCSWPPSVSWAWCATKRASRRWCATDEL